jgi:bacillithiol synthase
MSRRLDEDWRAADPRAQTLLGLSPDIDSLLHDASDLGPAAASLVATLRQLDLRGEADPARRLSIEKLAAGAPVIVTGQQPGLLGGPLLVSFKIATAILLARRLEDRGQPAVPVFWNASEDHDLDEANRLYLRAPDRSSTVLHHLELPGRGRSLDRVVLGADAAEALRRFFEASGESLGDETELPREGEDLGRWMSRLQGSRFAGSGLLIVEPRDLLRETRAIKMELLARDDELRAQWMLARAAITNFDYEPQLAELDASRSLMLLSDDDGRRRLIRRSGEIFDPHRDHAELLPSAINPDALSPSALLRPLVQQAALPVLAQVSGPAETRYFAECRPLFGLLGLRPPRLWPRVSGALLQGAEISAARELPDGLGLDDPETWPESSSELPAAWAEIRVKTRENLESELVKLEVSAGEDAQLVDLLGAIRRPLERGLRDFEAKMDKAHRRRDRDHRQRRERLREALHPRGRNQERLRSHGCYPRLAGEPLGNSLLSRMSLDHSSPQYLHWSEDA